MKASTFTRCFNNKLEWGSGPGGEGMSNIIASSTDNNNRLFSFLSLKTVLLSIVGPLPCCYRYFALLVLVKNGVIS